MCVWVFRSFEGKERKERRELGRSADLTKRVEGGLGVTGCCVLFSVLFFTCFNNIKGHFRDK